jgi:hypothetical protein
MSGETKYCQIYLEEENFFDQYDTFDIDFHFTGYYVYFFQKNNDLKNDLHFSILQKRKESNLFERLYRYDKHYTSFFVDLDKYDHDKMYTSANSYSFFQKKKEELVYNNFYDQFYSKIGHAYWYDARRFRFPKEFDGRRAKVFTAWDFHNRMNSEQFENEDILYWVGRN